jgi:hypothetical protein
LAKEWYGVKGKHFLFRYPHLSKSETFDNALANKVSHGNITYILLGNSAAEENCHIEAIEQLKNFAEYNIRIICPLSYMSTAMYVEQVINHGKRAFGKKFVPLLKLLNFEEYCKVLANIDIGVFFNDRQQGLSNIELLLYMGKKIYLKYDNPSYEEYGRKHDLKIYNAHNIRQSSLEDFICFDKKSAEQNHNIIKRIMSVDYEKDLWDGIFSYHG